MTTVDISGTLELELKVKCDCGSVLEAVFYQGDKLNIAELQVKPCPQCIDDVQQEKDNA